MLAEDMIDSLVICELDADVAAVWNVIFGQRDTDVVSLCSKILKAQLSPVYVRAIIDSCPTSAAELAFRTIMKNRCQRGGIMAPGAGILKAGERGRGLLSRWYPQTLVNRIILLRSLAPRVTFIQGDGFAVIRRFAKRKDAAFFIDPPYSLGTTKAGSRLYKHNVIDHERLFDRAASLRSPFVMTYDDDARVVELASERGFAIDRVPMRSTHHTLKNELIIKKA
jgi:DNA adenine methylase